MEGVYWDTSALVKLYAPESDSSAYLRFLLSQPCAVILSHLHLAELYFALCGKELRGEIMTGSARTLYELFERHCEEGRYFIIPCGADVMSKARFALDAVLGQSPPANLRTLDGLHLGAMLSCGVWRLLSADRRMHEAAGAIGLESVDI